MSATETCDTSFGMSPRGTAAAAAAAETANKNAKGGAKAEAGAKADRKPKKAGGKAKAGAKKRNAKQETGGEPAPKPEWTGGERAPAPEWTGGEPAPKPEWTGGERAPQPEWTGGAKPAAETPPPAKRRQLALKTFFVAKAEPESQVHAPGAVIDTAIAQSIERTIAQTQVFCKSIYFILILF